MQYQNQYPRLLGGTPPKLKWILKLSLLLEQTFVTGTVISTVYWFSFRSLYLNCKVTEEWISKSQQDVLPLHRILATLGTPHLLSRNWLHLMANKIGRATLGTPFKTGFQWQIINYQMQFAILCTLASCKDLLGPLEPIEVLIKDTTLVVIPSAPCAFMKNRQIKQWIHQDHYLGRVCKIP